MALEVLIFLLLGETFLRGAPRASHCPSLKDSNPTSLHGFPAATVAAAGAAGAAGAGSGFVASGAVGAAGGGAAADFDRFFFPVFLGTQIKATSSSPSGVTVFVRGARIAGGGGRDPGPLTGTQTSGTSSSSIV